MCATIASPLHTFLQNSTFSDPVFLHFHFLILASKDHGLRQAAGCAGMSTGSLTRPWELQGPRIAPRSVPVSLGSHLLLNRTGLWESTGHSHLTLRTP